MDLVKIYFKNKVNSKIVKFQTHLILMESVDVEINNEINSLCMNVVIDITEIVKKLFIIIGLIY